MKARREHADQNIADSFCWTQLQEACGSCAVGSPDSGMRTAPTPLRYICGSAAGRTRGSRGSAVGVLLWTSCACVTCLGRDYGLLMQSQRWPTSSWAPLSLSRDSGPRSEVSGRHLGLWAIQSVVLGRGKMVRAATGCFRAHIGFLLGRELLRSGPRSHVQAAVPGTEHPARGVCPAVRVGAFSLPWAALSALMRSY